MVHLFLINCVALLISDMSAARRIKTAERRHPGAIHASSNETQYEGIFSKKQPTFYFIRHAESTRNLNDYCMKIGRNALGKVVPTAPALNPEVERCADRIFKNVELTGLGKRQAIQAALDNSEVFETVLSQADLLGGRIYCSYLRRAIQTAVLIAGVLADKYPSRQLEVVPIPHIHEGVDINNCQVQGGSGQIFDVGCNDRNRWDQINGKLYTVAEIHEHMQASARKVGLHKNVQLNLDFVYGPDEVSSATMREKKPEEIQQRVARFYSFSARQRLLERGSALVVGHGAFIKHLSCLEHDQHHDWQAKCFLTSKVFHGNCAIAAFRYSAAMRLVACDVVTTGDLRLRRDISFRENTMPSLYPTDSTNFTLGELARAVDLDASYEVEVSSSLETCSRLAQVVGEHAAADLDQQQ